MPSHADDMHANHLIWVKDDVKSSKLQEPNAHRNDGLHNQMSRV